MKMLHKVLGCSTVAVVLAFSASTVQANLVVDPNFAGPTTANPITVATVGQGWALFNGGSSSALSDMSSSAYFPLGSPTVTSALLETAAPGNGWNPAGAYQVVSGITPGQKYTFSIWALTDTANDAYSATAGVLLQLGFELPDLSATSSVENPGGTVGIDAALPTTQGVWTEYSVSATAPAGYTDAVMYNMFQDNSSTLTTENMYYDLATLVPASGTHDSRLGGIGRCGCTLADPPSESLSRFVFRECHPMTNRVAFSFAELFPNHCR